MSCAALYKIEWLLEEFGIGDSDFKIQSHFSEMECEARIQCV